MKLIKLLNNISLSAHGERTPYKRFVSRGKVSMLIFFLESFVTKIFFWTAY